MSDATVQNPSPAPIVMKDVAISAALAPEDVVLENINWTVKSGDYWILGGLQTSGKSLLLAVAAGILRPLRGEFFLFGKDVARLSQEELARELLRVGLVFEGDGGLFTRLTVAENVALPLRYHQNWSGVEAAETVAAFLDETGLTQFANMPAGRVSRAARHRVVLARALVTSPEVLLLDNPLARLDPREAAWWLDFLKRLAAGHPLLSKRPLTLVVATDDFRPWREQGRQFALLDQGKLNCVGGRAQLTQSREPLLRELLAESQAAH